MRKKPKLIPAMALAWGLSFGLLLAAGTAFGQDNEHGAYNVRRHGYEHGYRDGYEYGRDARARHVALDFRTDAYRDAQQGYLPVFGAREEYREGYREGYRNGAEDGYNGVRTGLERTFGQPDNDLYSRHDRAWNYRDVAGDIGYRDGVNAGLQDYREHHSYRPEEHDAWKHANHGYTSAFGRKEEYTDAYRVAFEAGYRDGFGMRER